MNPILFLLSTAQASDFLDIWVTTAFEDTNIFAGPELYSPSANFVQRGNNTFFENYERRVTDDISRGNLVLYNYSDGFHPGWATESAFVLRYTPFLNPDMTQPGTNIRDDGSYVKIIRKLPGENHEISLTGYAVDSGRFRLGYSYDLTWGARSMFSFDPGAVPGVRLQWKNDRAYAFLGAKSAVGDYITPDTREPRNEAYYGFLGGGGIKLTENLKVEGGVGLFQQDQIKNVQSTDNELYGSMINALGYTGQISYKTSDKLKFRGSEELFLYKNNPDSLRDTYIFHPSFDGFGAFFMAEINVLQHNLLSPTDPLSTVVETGIAGDAQAVIINNNTSINIDLVYKDLPYILFNVPGLTSGVAMNPDMATTPQMYGRLSFSHHIPKLHFTPYLGGGLMQPATYQTEGGTFVQYTAYDKEQVAEGYDPSPIMSVVGGMEIDMSKSTVVVGELLYTVDNNLSDFVQSDDGIGGTRVLAPANERQALGFNLMMRSRF